MKNIKIYGVVMLIGIAIGCATNPLTGKKGLALVDNNSIFPQAFQQYSQFLSENKVINKDVSRFEPA